MSSEHYYRFELAHERYVWRIDSKIVLIGEEVLAQLMIDYNIRTAPIASYEIKRIDPGLFHRRVSR